MTVVGWPTPSTNTWRCCAPGIRRCARPRWHRLSPGRRCGDSATGGRAIELRAAARGLTACSSTIAAADGCGGAADIGTVRADGRGGAVTVARMLGVDVERLASDTAVLGTAGEGAARAVGAGPGVAGADARVGPFGGRGGDDPLAVMAGLPERLRADLDVLDGIREAAEAAWHGVSAVCARSPGWPTKRLTVWPVCSPTRRRRRRRSVRRLRGRAPGGRICPRGLARIDGLLGELDGGPDADLVLIGGGDPQPGCGQVDPRGRVRVHRGNRRRRGRRCRDAELGRGARHRRVDA